MRILAIRGKNLASLADEFRARSQALAWECGSEALASCDKKLELLKPEFPIWRLGTSINSGEQSCAF